MESVGSKHIAVVARRWTPYAMDNDDLWTAVRLHNGGRAELTVGILRV